MTLNSPLFLFVFLPIFLLVYFICPRHFQAGILLVFSALFYIWSEPFYFPIIFALAWVNFAIMRRMHRLPQDAGRKKKLLRTGVLVNLASLLIFKISAVYLTQLIGFASALGVQIPGSAVSILALAGHIPVGISFFSFQAIAMLVNAARADPARKITFSETFTSLFLFPKVIAGPIMGMVETTVQLRQLDTSLQRFAGGLRRFMIGFAKKALIADQLALVTHSGIFDIDPTRIPTGIAWLALVCYTFQIYFDFCAYTDMAIGLGQMCGLKIPENFNDPYIATSITDFWRRWHITLSNWFRTYVFFPLERMRKEKLYLSQSLNILIVFLLTGLWHGITPPYIIWGLLHGVALVAERGKFGKWLEKLWRPIRHFYTLGVIMIGWVFFRSPNVRYALGFLRSLVGFSGRKAPLAFSEFPPYSHFVWFALAAAVVLTIPWRNVIKSRNPQKQTCFTGARAWNAQNIFALIVFIAGLIAQAGTQYLPFIYGEF